MQTLTVRHVTHYTYANPVEFQPHRRGVIGEDPPGHRDVAHLRVKPHPTDRRPIRPQVEIQHPSRGREIVRPNIAHPQHADCAVWPMLQRPL